MQRATIMLISLLSLVIAAGCFAGETGTPFPTKDGFTLLLPRGWKPIPGEVLDAYEREIARMAPKAETQDYDYGFQLSSAGKWFAYPYILVQVKSSGKVPQEQLRSMARIGEAMDTGFDRARESISSIAANGKMGEPVLDEAAHTLWTRISVDVKGVGTINGLVGTILTEKGFIQISCYAKGEEFQGYLSLFEGMIRGAVLSDDLRYRPEGVRTPGGIGTGAMAGIAAALAAAGVLFLLVARGRRKKGKN